MEDHSQWMSRLVRLSGQVAVVAAIGVVLRGGTVYHWHWTKSLDTFAEKWTTISTLRPLRLRRSSKPRASAGWPAVVEFGQVEHRFGWSGLGTNVQFHSGVLVRTRVEEPVLAGPGGRVRAIDRSDGVGRVTLVVKPDCTLTFSDLGTIRARIGEELGPGGVIGQVRSDQIQIVLKDHGYPVNPEAPGLFAQGLVGGGLK